MNSSIPSEGRVEVYYNGTWGTICDNSWDINDGNVICRQLGYPGARSVYLYAYFGRGTGKIWLTSVYCSGRETNLTSCSKSPWGGYSWQRYCDHSRDAGVACHNKTAPGAFTLYIILPFPSCMIPLNDRYWVSVEVAVSIKKYCVQQTVHSLRF